MPSRYYNATTSSTVTNNTNYLPAPINTTQTLDVTDDAINNDYDIVVGTKLDHTIAPGSYTATITLTAVANPTPYTINYLANDGVDGASTANMPPSPQAGSVDGDSITLAPNAPVRNNYFFNGWCTTATTVDGACSGTTYYGNSTYNIDQTSDSNELNLYAMWNTSTCAGKTKLHDLVACQVKTTTDNANGTLTERTQTLSDMQAVIAGPITGDPSTDTSNSGVYKYDSTYYGAANDNPDNAKNTEDIYYFRGVLDSTYTVADQYGGVPSTGDGAYYHNYVRLHDSASDRADTCWRIVRTTATGGTKMIYNGAWDTTNNTCANAKDNAAAGSTYYNRGTTSSAGAYGTQGFVVYVGYNYNSEYAYNNTQYTNAMPNSELFNNETSSNLRLKTEEWYAKYSNLSSYESNNKLETSAGWCDDRTTTKSPAIMNTTIPYALSSVEFGASIRLASRVSLKCPNVTGYDLLTVSNGIAYPLAHLTADEAALVGNGYYHHLENPAQISPYSSNYSHTSFLRNGSFYWLMSPRVRADTEQGIIRISQIDVSGCTGNPVPQQEREYRPSISLAPAVTISSGTGTSTDPWVIEP